MDTMCHGWFGLEMGEGKSTGTAFLLGATEYYLT